MIHLTTEQYGAILKVLENADYDGTCSHVVNSFSDNFKPDPRGEITVEIEVSEDIGLLTMRDRDIFGVSYIEVTDKSVKRIDPRDIKIRR